MRARLGSLRVRLTITVAILSAAGLAAGAALLIRAVEHTVIRAIEDHSREELRRVGTQIAHGVPLKEVRAGAPNRMLSFVRPDGSRVDVAERIHEDDDGDHHERHVRVERGPRPVDEPLPAEAGLRCDSIDDLVAGEVAGPIISRPPPGIPAPGVSARGLIALPAPPVLARPNWSVVEQAMLSPRDGPVRAFALSPLEDVLHSMRILQHVLTLGLPVLVIALSIAAWLIVGRALRPVRAMTHHASGIADATAPERLAVPPTAELSELAHTLNAMLDRLAGAAHRQREFVSDASHELRSPIAATRALVEVGLAHPDRVEPSVVLGGVLAETTRLELLVADLLALARLDEQSAQPHGELDLDDIVLEDAVRTRAVAVDTRGVAAVKVHGDRKSLGHLIRNLLDNAARHATSRVEVSTLIDERSAVLRVDDDGPGIPEGDRERIFERFTRLSSSRSRNDGGAGLGLALVRRIAEQHAAIARVERSPQGGARFEVRFPSRGFPGAGG